jgi:hypothetical protein
MDKQIYTQELKQVLLKVSNEKLKPDIAQKVAEEYVKNLDFTEHALMCVGSTSVAKNLIVHVKSKHFLK